MIDKIKKALDEVANLNLNLGSESARDFLAQKINDVIKKETNCNDFRVADWIDVEYYDFYTSTDNIGSNTSSDKYYMCSCPQIEDFYSVWEESLSKTMKKNDESLDKRLKKNDNSSYTLKKLNEQNE